MNFNVFLENSGPFSLTPWLFVSSDQLSVLPGGSCKLPVHVRDQQNCRDPGPRCLLFTKDTFPCGCESWSWNSHTRAWHLAVRSPRKRTVFPSVTFHVTFPPSVFKGSQTPPPHTRCLAKAGQEGTDSGPLCLVSYFFCLLLSLVLFLASSLNNSI